MHVATGFTSFFVIFLYCRMQLAIDVQIPQEFGGLDCEAIYIGKLQTSNSCAN